MVGPAQARRSLPKAVVAAISLAAVVAAGIGWAVLPTLDVASDPTELAEGLPELADVEKVDQRIGFSSEITLVVRGEKRSEEHTSELQSLMRNSYAVFCLKKKTQINYQTHTCNDL